MIRISLVEDDITIRKNLSAFIGFYKEFELSHSCGSVEEFIYQLQHAPKATDVLLLDIGLPGISGLEGIPKIKEVLPEIDIIMLTTFDEEEKIVQALRSGACSYLSKKTSLERIMETVKIVHAGGSYMSPAIARKLATFMSQGSQSLTKTKLTPKQEEIIQGLVDGLSYKGLAEKLGISVSTVKTHIKRIYHTLHVNSKAEAVAKYLKA